MEDQTIAVAQDPALTPAQETDRRDASERRAGADRRRRSREEAGYTGPERRDVVDRRTGLERRRGPGLRRSDDRRAAEEGEMTDEQFEFVMAIETYKKVNRRLFPTWTEVLEVILQLGYRKVEHRTVDLESVPEPALNKPSPHPDRRDQAEVKAA